MFKLMDISKLEEYTNIFVRVFNNPPWCDSWTYQTAEKRIHDMMSAPTFFGLSLYQDNTCIGIIFGQKEQFYNGVHFQIQEFCIDTNYQGIGYGTKLLNEFISKLESIGVYQVYLITSKDEKTEGFYNRKGFETSKNMIVMFKK